MREQVSNVKTEKQKMLAGEPYQAWDKELYAARIECRKVLQKLNNSIPDTQSGKRRRKSLFRVVRTRT